jgi:Putative MetA-pathway of phenol degradation
MKPLVLVLIMLLPEAVFAQERDTSLTKDQQDTIGLVQADASLTRNDLGVSNYPRGTTRAELAFGQASSSQPRKAKPTQAKPSEETTRPKTEGSMVGYIENAVVGSQVRIRFDAGFNFSTPDLAEFFYAKCACYKGLATLNPQAFDPNAAGPGPGVPKTLNFQQLYLNAEYAPHRRFSAFVEVPFRWIQPQSFAALPIPPFAPFSNQGGLSDVRAGFKVAMLASYTHYLTVQFKTYFPSGDASRGLGTNHYSIEPTLLYYQKLSDRVSLESMLGDWHPIGGSAGVPTSGSEKFSGDVFLYGVGPSYELYRGPKVRFAPVVELVGWNIRGGFETLLGGPVLGVAREMTGTNIVNIKVGARTSFGNRSSLYVGYGRALTNVDWYDNLVRIEYRYSF